MKRPLLIRSLAAKDLASAKLWYERQRPGLGDEFLAAASDALRRIEEHPELLPVYYRDYRRVLVERFPYKIFYRILEDRIRILPIRHTSRRNWEGIDTGRGKFRCK